MRKRKVVLLAVLLCLLLSVSAKAARTPLIALTFDDGPNNKYTPQVLDILQERNARATFFLVGRWLPGKNHLLEREVKEGHQIASHTFDHLYLTSLCDEDVRKQIDDTAAALKSRTGLSGFMVRCPYGAHSERVLSQLNAPAIHWSIDPAEGKLLSAEVLAKRVVSQAKDGAIILMHDSTQANVDATALIVDALHQKGYEFVTVGELFRLRGITPENGKLYRSLPPTGEKSFDEARLAEHWAAASLQQAAMMGVLTADKGCWRPEAHLTRGEAATALWRLAGAPKLAPSSSTLAWAKAQGIIQGKGTSLPDPAEPIKREQLYVMLNRLMQSQWKQLCAVELPAAYQDDRRISPYAVESVGQLRERGFASANDVELFRPGELVTRAEAAELLAWYATK